MLKKSTVITLLVIVLLSAGPGAILAQNGGDRVITPENADQVVSVGMLGRGTVTAMAWSLDGSTLAVGGSAGLWLYNPGDLNAPPVLLEGHESRLYSLAYSPDGSILVSGGYPTARLWDVETGEELAVLTGLTHYAEDMAFSPDGSTLVCGTWGYIRRWDMASGKQLERWEVQENPILAIAYAPDGSVIATGGEDRLIVLSDAETGDQVRVLASHSDIITGLEYSPDGSMLASASKDRTIRLWDATTYEEIAVIEDLDNGVSQVAFSADGAVLMSLSRQGFVRLWDATTHRMIATARADATVAALSVDGHTLATGTTEHSITLWSVSDDYRDLSAAQQLVWPGHYTSVTGIAFRPDGNLVSCSGLRYSSNDSTIRLWDTASGEQLAVLMEQQRAGISDCALSPSGDIVAAVSDQTISLVDTENGAVLNELDQDGEVTKVVFSPDGNILAFSSGNAIQLWDMAAGGEGIVTLEGHIDAVMSLAFSPDGTILASGGGKSFATDENDTAIRLWDVATGEQLAILQGHDGQVISLAFSPDGTSLVSSAGGPDKTIRLWNVETASEELVIYEDLVGTVLFSPDGKLLATGTTDHVIRLWNAEMWYPVVALKTYAQSLGSLVFSPDGTILASAGGDATIRLWGIGAAGD